MSFSNALIARVLQAKRDRKERAIAECEAARDAARAQFPEIRELEDRLGTIGAGICRAAFAGNQTALAALKRKSEAVSAKLADLKTRAGFPDSPVYDCPLCEDSGYQDGRLCDCAVRMARDLCYRDLCAKMPIEQCRFDNFRLDYYSTEKTEDNGAVPRDEATRTLNVCQKFVREFPCGKNLFLYGGSGLGKTHLSLAIANEILKKNYGVVYATVQDIVDKIRKERFSSSDGDEIISSVNGCDLLILDDLGAEITTSQSSSILFHIINTRILEHRSTVINSNLGLTGLRERYEARIVSRLYGDYTKRPFYGKDIRQRRCSGDLPSGNKDGAVSA